MQSSSIKLNDTDVEYHHPFKDEVTLDDVFHLS